jgi:phosphate acetyltransferase
MMSGIVETIRRNAALTCRTVVLPESHDERILRAAIAVHSAGIARPILLGRPQDIVQRARELGLDLKGIAQYDPSILADSKPLQAYLRSRRRFQNLSDIELREALGHPLILACCLLGSGEVDACVAGAAYTTTEVIQQALRIVGTAEDSPLLSSFFLMVFDDPPVEGLNFSLYADCAININPNSQQLANIAQSTAESAQRIFKLDPRIALLSFSTAGSSSHEDVDKVAAAYNEIRRANPALKVMGEVQFDAALLPAIRKLKFENAPYSEPANVYIFPNLDAGNIAYKITERLGGAQAIGPILQGLSRPLNDLSRGADVDSIVNTIAMSCLQANGARGGS